MTGLENVGCFIVAAVLVIGVYETIYRFMWRKPTAGWKVFGDITKWLKGRK